MATISERPGQQAAQVNGAQGRATTPELAGVTPRATTLDWGNSAPLALLAFAVTTFMLSMVNADAIAKGVEPVVFGVALMFGGLTQLIAGLIQLRVGNTVAHRDRRYNYEERGASVSRLASAPRGPWAGHRTAFRR
jgi:hypothetical protein